MTRKTLAVVLLVVGLGMFPPFNLFDFGGLAWPVSIALILVGAYVLAKAPPARREGLPLPLGPKQPKSSFTTQQGSDDYLEVSVIPATKEPSVVLPVLLACVVATTAAFPVMIVAYAAHNMGYLLLVPAIGLVVGYLGMMKLNHDPRSAVGERRLYLAEYCIHLDRRDGSLLVDIPTSQARRVQIRQTVGEGVTEVVSFAGGLAGSLGNLTEHMGYKARETRQNWLADNSYVLEIEAAGKTHLLAGGLDEATAYSLGQLVTRTSCTHAQLQG